MPKTRWRSSRFIPSGSCPLHEAIFLPLLMRDAPEGAKAHALANVESRLGLLETLLTTRDFVIDRFSVADAYLFTVLNWAQVTPIELSRWPALGRYMSRMRARPHVKDAVRLEGELYARK